jgi:hypothetical protein
MFSNINSVIDIMYDVVGIWFTIIKSHDRFSYALLHVCINQRACFAMLALKLAHGLTAHQMIWRNLLVTFPEQKNPQEHQKNRSRLQI